MRQGVNSQIVDNITGQPRKCLLAVEQEGPFASKEREISVLALSTSLPNVGTSNWTGLALFPGGTYLKVFQCGSGKSWVELFKFPSTIGKLITIARAVVQHVQKMSRITGTNMAIEKCANNREKCS